MHADGSEMCISVMTVILKSLVVASARGRVAEVFGRNRFGGAAVGTGFGRRIHVKQETGWMIERQCGPAGVACGRAASLVGTTATVCGNQRRSGSGGPGRSGKTSAASSTRVASVASDTDTVEKDQMGEKPVSSNGSPMCQTFCGAMMMIGDIGVKVTVTNEIPPRAVEVPKND